VAALLLVEAVLLRSLEEPVGLGAASLRDLSALLVAHCLGRQGGSAPGQRALPE